MNKWRNSSYRREHYKSNPEFREICKKASRDFRKRNLEKCKAAARRHYALNSDKIKIKQVLKRNGITLDFLTDLFHKQNKQCAICKKSLSSMSSRASHVDHNHDTGKVRGILCHQCNTGTGWLEKNQALIYDALNYITN